MPPQHDNYFKSSRRKSLGGTEDTFFFFNSADLAGCLAAWVSANAVRVNTGGTVSMFAPPKHRGQWDKLAGVVGHRHFDEILDDLVEANSAGDAAENAALHDEMDSLQGRWRKNVELH